MSICPMVSRMLACSPKESIRDARHFFEFIVTFQAGRAYGYFNASIPLCFYLYVLVFFMPGTKQESNPLVCDYSSVLGWWWGGSLKLECFCAYILAGEFALEGFEDCGLWSHSLQYGTKKFLWFFKVKPFKP
ncbi:hypothetical protein A7R79_12035 [Pseudomonas aeruginosa]|nr:hypothetical protein A7R79_12035 [Pseudomonas aeruginosa]